MFAGFDMDRTMLRISAMNLMLHSITNPDIDYKDSVSKQNSIRSKYTVCLANRRSRAPWTPRASTTT